MISRSVPRFNSTFPFRAGTAVLLVACLLFRTALGQTPAVAVAPQVSSDTGAGETSPVVLNPFNVNADTDVGYGASATAATSRVLQNYVDIPQTVSVVTSQFLTDFNLQDVREALEYVPNLQFGLTNNASAVQIRGARVTQTYVDGVAMPAQYTAMPVDFFDRIEVIKGPSSAAFGLGQPGGIINYVSKTPQGTEATSLTVGGGGNDNFLARLDTQGVSSKDSRLSYRLAAFWDDGGYETPNVFHSGAGGQLALRYDFDSTTRLDLITAYSQTTYPSEGIQGSIWMNQTIYLAWQAQQLGSGIYKYLPGTVFPNGSVFGVSGTLPPPGTVFSVPGTGQFLGVGANPNPQGWNDANNNTERDEIILTKDLAGGHIHLRNAFNLEFDQSSVHDETPAGILSVPGSGNTPVAAGTIPTALINGAVHPDSGPPLFYIGEPRMYTVGQGASRSDELDLLAQWHFWGADWQSLIGGNVYDTEGSTKTESIPDTNADGSLAYVNLYSSNNPPVYVPSTYTITAWNNTHSWGDGFYGQEDVKLLRGHLDLLAGWRIDYFDTETRNYATGTKIFPGWVNTKGAPRYAATIKPWDWLSFYSLYTVHKDPTQSTTKYFQSSGTEWSPALMALYPPGQLEFYQPGGYTVEEGMKASFFGGKLFASVAVFHELTTGQLNPTVVANVINPDGTSTQIAQQQVQGLNAHGMEIELFGQPTRRLSFNANYGFNHGYFPAFANGLPDFFNPSATLSLHGKLDLGDLRGNGFYVTFGGEWFSPYWIYQAANAYVYYNSSQYVFDGGIGYRWKWGRYRNRLYFNMDNIMDKLISIGSITPWTTEPLRSEFLNYTVSF